MRSEPLGLPEPPWIVGHRGAAGEAPENTLASFRLALEQGTDMIELDLQLTADGALVACHDWDLRRLLARAPAGDSAEGGNIEGTVVETSTLSALRRSDLELPTLPEILAALPADTPLNLELKRRRADRQAFAHALRLAVADRSRLLISSFDWTLLAAVRELEPERPLAPVGRVRSPPLLAAAERLGAWSVHCHRRMVAAPLVAATHDRGRPLLAFTVNDPAEARRFFDLGVDGVFTDHPGRLRRELAER